MRIRAVTLVSLALVCAPIMGGCTSLMFWRDKGAPSESAAEPVKANAGVKPKGGAFEAGEQELKLAKLWARVDELEAEQFRQKEHIRLLEKGLTLGLMPEELKTPAPPAAGGHGAGTNHHPSEPVSEQTPPVAAPVAAKAAAGTLGALSKEDSDKYQALLANAQDEYRAGRYGRAVVDFTEIDKLFGDKVDGGMPLYWIAKSWANLKEYTSARQLFIDFLKAHGTSSWAARAKLELARVEWQLGLQETALARLREVIQEHPEGDAAEMAKMELETLDKKL